MTRTACGVRLARHRDRYFLRVLWHAFCVACGMTGTPSAGEAGTPDSTRKNKPLSLETWSGADVFSRGWFFYSGTTWAPGWRTPGWPAGEDLAASGGLYGNGLRLRIAGGYGGYEYRGRRWIERETPEEDEDGSGTAGEVRKKSFAAVTGFLDVLAGYLHRSGSLTAKGFVGVSAIGHRVQPFDRDNSVQGTEIGAKGVAELWFDPGERTWSSLDLSWTSAHRTGSLHARSAYRLAPHLSAGAEARFNTNSESRHGRGGLFLRYDW